MNDTTPPITFGDWSRYIVTITLNDTTAITDAVKALPLTADERAAVLALVGVRTLGDLRAERNGDIKSEREHHNR